MIIQDDPNIKIAPLQIISHTNGAVVLVEHMFTGKKYWVQRVHLYRIGLADGVYYSHRELLEESR